MLYIFPTVGFLNTSVAAGEFSGDNSLILLASGPPVMGDIMVSLQYISGTAIGITTSICILNNFCAIYLNDNYLCIQTLAVLTF